MQRRQDGAFRSGGEKSLEQLGPELLRVRNLRTIFPNEEHEFSAVDGVSLDLAGGETLALVGESGSGKTSVALSILRLVPPPGRIESGEIRFDGQDLLSLSEERMRGVRGRRIAMIFQEPSVALNPLTKISAQMVETIRAHGACSRAQGLERARDALREVGVDDVGWCLDAYPHQLSGGTLQRVLIAAALSCRPDLLIGDEPTSALDVTVQAQILDLLKRLRDKRSLSMLLISHDLGVVAQLADRVAVMYAGEIVETGPTPKVFASPSHPYTAKLLSCAPRIRGKGQASQRMEVVEGTPPRTDSLPQGCRFHPRCIEAVEECRRSHPELEALEPGRLVRCWRRRADGGEAELATE